MDIYIIEANSVIEKEVISRADQKILRLYRIVSDIDKLLKWFRLIKTEWLGLKVRYRYFGYPPMLRYNTTDLHFELHPW